MAAVHQGPGPAGEITQARLREQLAASGAEDPSNPAEGLVAPPEPPVSDDNGPPVGMLDVPPPPIVAPVIDSAKAETTGRIPLQALPDAEVAALCQSNGIDAQGLKSRAEAEAALVAKGIDSVPTTRV